MGLILYLPLFYFNYKNYFLLARTYGLAAAWYNITTTSIVMGTKENFHLYLLAVVTVSFFYYDFHERIFKYSVICIVSLTYILL